MITVSGMATTKLSAPIKIHFLIVFSHS